MSETLLFELGVEELPISAVESTAISLLNNVEKLFLEEGIVHSKLVYYATPRRITIYVQNIELEKETTKSIKKGPLVLGSMDENSKPMPQLLGFARSCGVEIAQLQKIQQDKGEYWVYEIPSKKVNVIELLPDIFQKAVYKINLSKPMKWGKADFVFVRPVQWILFLLGNKVVNAKIFNLSANNITYGHRFLAPTALKIEDPKEYLQILSCAYVEADFSVRKSKIKKQLEDLAQKNQLDICIEDDLLQEVTSLVEWPVAVIANFEKKFLDLPKEVLIAVLRKHQKCFPMYNKDGSITNKCVAVSNIQNIDMSYIIKGNEKVIAARLEDAKFFYTQDKKHSLLSKLDATKNVVLQAGLGSLYDKICRLELWMLEFSKIFSINAELAKKVALLSKCDLLTNMVLEFPELQGIIGYYYALNDNENMEVALAIRDQYLPVNAHDVLANTTLGLSIAFADKIDNIAGNILLGNKLSSDKDPFKLRRSALALIRILIEFKKPLKLTEFIEKSLNIYKMSSDNMFDEHTRTIHKIILDRIPAFYQTQGIEPHIVSAALVNQNDDLYDLHLRILALAKFCKTKTVKSLLQTFKRVDNILKSAKNINYNLDVQDKLLESIEEKNLFATIIELEPKCNNLYAKSEYLLILDLLATLDEPLKIFFEKVMVMSDNQALKLNRLAILYKLKKLLNLVVDFNIM